MSIMAILDIDGTLCKSVYFEWIEKHGHVNDNSIFLKPEFLKMLKEAKPYPWVFEQDWDKYICKYVITGRMEEHYGITKDWMYEILKTKIFDVLLVGWDDTLESRSKSYFDYMHRKVLKIASVITCHPEIKEIHIYEDDGAIISFLENMWELWNVKIFKVHEGELTQVK